MVLVRERSLLRGHKQLGWSLGSRAHSTSVLLLWLLIPVSCRESVSCFSSVEALAVVLAAYRL